MGDLFPQLFGVIPTGAPCITTPTSAPSQTSFVYELPIPGNGKRFSHIVVFLLPGITLPPSTAAAVYISLPPSTTTPSIPTPAPTFKFLGGIGPGKESAVFKISGLGSSQNTTTGGIAEVDMDADDSAVGGAAGGNGGNITIGISIESAESVSSQMAALQSQSSITSFTNLSNNSQALVLSASVSKPTAKRPDTLLLAQRIIKNAFNFLASFSGNANGGIEVVPLKAFEEWWRKFEGRVRSDPGFLERSEGD